MNNLLTKKNIYYSLAIILVLVLLAVFMPKGILMEPLTTPEEYLSLKPYTVLFGLTIIVPTSTIIVYLLGILILYIGIMLLLELNKNIFTQIRKKLNLFIFCEKFR